MPFEVVMPRLGWSMEKGILVKWHKQDGERVQVGDILFTVEADKANQEVEALESGVLRIPPGSPALGSVIPVGTLLAYLLQPGEADPAVAGERTVTAAPAAVAVVAPPPVAALAPSASPARSVTETPAISPRARRVARELGVEWASLHGSGRTGRIVERDVQRAAEALALALPLQRRLPDRLPAAVTLTTEADATEWVGLRRRLVADASDDDFWIHVLGRALVEHPAMNARWEGDAIVQSAAVNVGLVVETGHGPVTPVLRDAQAKPLLQIARESAALIEAALAGRLDPADLQGATFTLTNLGAYGIDAFTPILDPPECAVLGVGRITPKQVVVQAKTSEVARTSEVFETSEVWGKRVSVAIRHMVFLSLSFDRRLAVEREATAARFLQRVRQYVEQPFLLLMG